MPPKRKNQNNHRDDIQVVSEKRVKQQHAGMSQQGADNAVLAGIMKQVTFDDLSQ